MRLRQPRVAPAPAAAGRGPARVARVGARAAGGQARRGHRPPLLGLGGPLSEPVAAAAPRPAAVAARGRAHSLAQPAGPAQTAAQLGIAERGTIAPGFHADLVLFDPARIADRADLEHPNALATGVSTVWVNGAVVFDKGVPTAARPGQVVRRAGWRPGG